MSLIKSTALIGTLAFITKVAAHGIVTGVVADGKYFEGYSPNFQYQQNPPDVAGWTAPLTQDHGFVAPDAYGSPDIICHKGATPGKAYIQVSAGGKLELQWTEWPVSHHGPMLDYLAPCGDDCTTVDKSSLQWTKIDEAGMNSWVTQPGDWASDDMIKNNNTWVTTIPSSIAPGKYVLRHETIALHSANNPDGAQNYPQCMNVEISGSGTNSLSSGTLGTDLYKSTDPGILINIYYPALTSYDIPGPKVMEGGSSGSPAPSASSSSPADVSVTATPSTGIAVPSGSLPPYPMSGNSTVTKPATPATPEATASSSEPWSDWSYSSAFSAPETAINVPSVTASAPDVPADTSKPSPPPVVSFSSTVTGRIGKPTKFVCYLEED